MIAVDTGKYQIRLVGADGRVHTRSELLVMATDAQKGRSEPGDFFFPALWARSLLRRIVSVLLPRMRRGEPLFDINDG
jgi:hypothetical protein